MKRSMHQSNRALFSIYCYGDHRDLHSFPTRRSSDLRLGDDAEVTAAPVGHHEGFDVDALVPVDRSEEHTSELQSRRDLVCRLLLEKKNIHSIQHNATESGIIGS